MTKSSTEYVEDYDYEDISCTLETWRLRHQDIIGGTDTKFMQTCLNRIRSKECYAQFTQSALDRIHAMKLKLYDQGML
jgi:hypothetical protein